jgi:predicted nucleic acid-binding Zn ribbon protein
MNRKNAPLERLGTVLDQSIKRLDLAGRLDEYGIWPVWNDTVGTTIARNAQPEKIRHGTLFVKVSSPVWMQQLQYMKEMIAEKLNQRLRAEVVKNVFFVVGRVETDQAPANSNAKAPAPQADVKFDEEFLQSIADADIRQAFKRLVASYQRRKQKQ